MVTSVTKARLTELSRKLAYALLDNAQPWHDHDVGRSLLDVEPGEKIGEIGTFQGLMEMGPDGKARPISEKTRQAIRDAHANIVGSRERRIAIPKDWAADEAALACLVVEGALFRLGFKPFIFNETGDLAEISMDSGYTPSTVPEKIYLRTNVGGAVETLDYAQVAREIEATIGDIVSGWVSSKQKGRPILSKRVDVVSHFPFLDQFAQHYANAVGLEESLRHVSPGRGGLANCSIQEAQRHMILHEQAGYPFPRVEVVLSGELANQFVNDMEVMPVKTPRRRSR